MADKESNVFDEDDEIYDDDNDFVDEETLNDDDYSYQSGRASNLLSIFTPTEKNVFDTITWFAGFMTFTFAGVGRFKDNRITLSIQDGRSDRRKVEFDISVGGKTVEQGMVIHGNDEIEDFLDRALNNFLPEIVVEKLNGLGLPPSGSDYVLRSDLSQFFFYAENDDLEVVRLYCRPVSGTKNNVFSFEKLYYKARNVDIDESLTDFFDDAPKKSVKNDAASTTGVEQRSAAMVEDFHPRVVAEFFIQLGDSGRRNLQRAYGMDQRL